MSATCCIPWQRTCRILPMSAMVMDKGGMAPLADFHDTVLPSADTDTVPSCFLYWAAALDMLVEERGCRRSPSREPQMYSIT
jgi:hypothetical protein